MARTNFTTPVGRMVMGSLYEPQTKDAEGHPLLVKSGPNAGQPKQVYFFALAIPKGQETHWSQTPWGQTIYKVGTEAFPQVHQSPTFAWKIVDGDSQVPNSKGKKPCDRIGYPGHWVLSFSSGFAPKLYKRPDGQKDFVPFKEPNGIKLGYYIQVNGDVDGNGSTQRPGVFLNHSMVAFLAYGEEIFVGPDANEVGFGADPLPAGASTVPAAGFAPPATATPPATPPAAMAPPPAAQPPMPPNPAIMNTPAAAPVHQMTEKAQGMSYEQMIAAGWNDALLIQHGMMIG